MMITNYSVKQLLVCVLMSICGLTMAQSEQQTVIGFDDESSELTTIRAKNIVMPGGGFALVNNDYQNPVYENFGHLGYKRFLGRALNVNVNYRKYYLDFDQQEFSDNGFMSFDLNVEYYVFPQNKLTPYVFLGSGLVLSNDFDDANNKFQGGIGVEYLLAEKLALTLVADGNYVLNQAEDTFVFQNVDEVFVGAAIGVHFYFGNKSSQKTRVAKTGKETEELTVISANPIIHN